MAPATPHTLAHQYANLTTAPGAPLGVAAHERAATPAAARLVKAHAAVVDGFVARGHAAAMEVHAAPARK